MTEPDIKVSYYSLCFTLLLHMQAGICVLKKLER